MAGDSRDPENPNGETSEPFPKPPEPVKGKPRHEFPKSQVGKLWEEFGNPEEPVNLMPGGTYNSAGGKPKEPELKDIISSMSFGGLTSFYKTPCARDSLLVAIGAGFGTGGIRAVLGGMSSIWKSCNWAVGSFAVVSIAAHQFCERRRIQERDGMKEAVELMAKLRERKQKERDEAEAAARLAEEERRRKSWTNLSNYKFW